MIYHSEMVKECIVTTRRWEMLGRLMEGVFIGLGGNVIAGLLCGHKKSIYSDPYALVSLVGFGLEARIVYRFSLSARSIQWRRVVFLHSAKREDVGFDQNKCLREN